MKQKRSKVEKRDRVERNPKNITLENHKRRESVVNESERNRTDGSIKLDSAVKWKLREGQVWKYVANMFRFTAIMHPLLPVKWPVVI